MQYEVDTHLKMHISEFRITNFRNITSETLSFHPQVNLIEGVNGSGKTSLLEALYFLSHGRSFKANQLNRIIQYEKLETTLFAQFNKDQTLALQKNKNGTTNLRLNQNNIKTQSELTRQMPIQILHPGSFSILSATAKYRCQLFDWGAFYNQNQFLLLWSKAKRLIKQRNSLLKQNPNYTLLKPWDLELSIVGTQLDQLRSEYITKLIDEVNTLLPLFNQNSFGFEYHRGWPQSENLETSLKNHLAQDIKSGFTHHGPHRADLKIMAGHLPASDVLSRGQQKLLILILKLAQGNLFYKEHQTACIYIIDDLLSELDQTTTELVLDFFKQQKAQVFISAINAQLIKRQLQAKQYQSFHIDKGKIILN
ncbi:DNA replication/repair protein RecF [Thiotrichales bacterium 19S11-10]|nr:DNA replication/repair protein RecF [Thiotrichales bacterium 19S11-10]